MDNKIGSWLEDIVRSIDEIEEFLPDKKISALFSMT